MLYPFARGILFSFDAEAAHELTIAALRASRHLPTGAFACEARGKTVSVMGLDFPNRVGLAAGLDKNGVAIDGFAKLGFGFIEVGTVTPRPQAGNPRPRLFRIVAARAIVNRMGFNNAGVDALAGQLRTSRFRAAGGIIGVNIGKNFDTAIDRAADDYVCCLEKVYELASYVAINVSSPNTKNLRDLQGEAQLDALLATLVTVRERLADRYGRRLPLALKIAPDLDEVALDAIAALLARHRIDAVIATNTTLARDKVSGLPHADESGGLSGAPLFERSTAVVSALARRLAGQIPIIAVGGIMSGADARAKLAAGATLVQLYTGLVYQGPSLVTEAITNTR